MRPILIALLAGLPAVIYGIYAIVKFTPLTREIAVAQGRVSDWAQHGGENGLNRYQVSLFEQFMSGAPPQGIEGELLIRARWVAKHLRWSTWLNLVWLAALIATYWITEN